MVNMNWYIQQKISKEIFKAKHGGKSIEQVIQEEYNNKLKLGQQENKK